MATKSEISGKLLQMGFSKSDVEPLVDCMFREGSVSWINTDAVDGGMLKSLEGLIAENGFRVRVSVTEVPTRGKYIWDVKALQ